MPQFTSDIGWDLTFSCSIRVKGSVVLDIFGHHLFNFVEVHQYSCCSVVTPVAEPVERRVACVFAHGIGVSSIVDKLLAEVLSTRLDALLVNEQRQVNLNGVLETLSNLLLPLTSLSLGSKNLLVLDSTLLWLLYNLNELIKLQNVVAFDLVKLHHLGFASMFNLDMLVFFCFLLFLLVK